MDTAVAENGNRACSPPDRRPPTITESIRSGTVILGFGVVMIGALLYYLHGGPHEYKKACKPAGALETPFVPLRLYPYAGARSENGTWGYVGDMGRVRNWFFDRVLEFKGDSEWGEPPVDYLPLNSEHEQLLVCSIEPGEAQEKPLGFDMLQNVKVHLPEEKEKLKYKTRHDKGGRPRADAEEVAGTGRTRKLKSYPEKKDKLLLCVVDTDSKHHYLLRATVETWAWRCDGFFAASDQTVTHPGEVGFGSIDIPSDNPVQKLYSVLVYIDRNHRMDYDYFYIAPPGVHVIVENLRYLLMGLEAALEDENEPIYAGEVGSTGRTRVVDPAAGVLLNRIAIRKLVNIIDNCKDAEGKTHYYEGGAGKTFGYCMANKAKIDPMDMADSDGKLVFHGMVPAHLAYADGRRGHNDKKFNFWVGDRNISTGAADLVSPSTVAFATFNTPVSLKRHHALLYNSCPASSVLGKALQSAKGS